MSQRRLRVMRIIFETENRQSNGPAIFLDRDGVINRRKPNDYVLEWSQFVFIPGIRKALRELSSLGLPLLLISNQAAVGKGLLARSALESITRRLHETLSTDGTTINAYYYCVHKADDGCDCRKPRPGLLVRAAVDFRVDMTRSIFIGDSETDVQAAWAAGCEPILFGSGVRKSSGLEDWAAGVAIASTAEMLYQVGVERLRALPSHPLHHGPSKQLC